MHEQARQMIEQLETPGNRLKTALLLVPPARLDRVEDIAAHLLADVEDIARMALEAVPPGSQYANLNASRIAGWLDAISEKKTGQRRALVVNLDLLLAGVSESARAEVWQHLRNGMPYRRRVVVVSMPDRAEHLLPRVEEWEAMGRCVRL